MDWFLYDNGLRHERVKPKLLKLLNHCSTATVLMHAVSITADFDASATNISDFDYEGIYLPRLISNHI